MSVEMNVYVRKRIRLLKVVISPLRRFVNQVSARETSSLRHAISNMAIDHTDLYGISGHFPNMVITRTNFQQESLTLFSLTHTFSLYTCFTNGKT